MHLPLPTKQFLVHLFLHCVLLGTLLRIFTEFLLSSSYHTAPGIPLIESPFFYDEALFVWKPACVGEKALLRAVGSIPTLSH